MAEPSSTETTPIVFFDGLCGLCDRFIQFLLKEDQLKLLKFAPLQGKSAKLLLPHEYLQNLRSIVFFDHRESYEKSDAVIRIFSGPIAQSRPAWKLILLLRIVPKGVRDFFYDWIANYRYHWFGKRETCVLPDAETQERFMQ